MSIANNVRIYGLYESMVASGYPMLTEPPTETEFQALICERSAGTMQQKIKKSESALFIKEVIYYKKRYP